MHSSTNRGQEQALETLREMMSEVLRLRGEGGSYAKLTQATGRLDGYAQALVDLGLFSDREILTVVSAQRSRDRGPATGKVSVAA